jgi:hypothetical protein
VGVAGRRSGGALLGSGLFVVTLLGGAGGYGAGLWTTATQSDASMGSAAPLSALSPSTTPSTPSEPSPPPKTVQPDDSPPLLAGDLSYKTRQFVAKSVVRSSVRLKVPADWWMTQPDPPKLARFTDPTNKRWIRIEAGFSIRRPPVESMAERIAALKTISPDQMVKIVSQEGEPGSRTATLVYTYVPEQTLYVIVRWVALDDSGNCAVEMSSTGLPQDRKALMDVLDHATESVTRTDSPL